MVALLTQPAQAGNCFVPPPDPAQLQVNVVSTWKVIWQPTTKNAETEGK